MGKRFIRGIYFTYTVHDVEKFSRVTVFLDSPRLELFNADPRLNEDYLRARLKADNQLKENLEEIKKDIQQLPDSSRKQIDSTLKKVFSQ
jgi:hypothetical protein